jgi:hypothetical protein
MASLKSLGISASGRKGISASHDPKLSTCATQCTLLQHKAVCVVAGSSIWCSSHLAISTSGSKGISASYHPKLSTCVVPATQYTLFVTSDTASEASHTGQSSGLRQLTLGWHHAGSPLTAGISHGFLTAHPRLCGD